MLIILGCNRQFVSCPRATSSTASRLRWCKVRTPWNRYAMSIWLISLIARRNRYGAWGSVKDSHFPQIGRWRWGQRSRSATNGPKGAHRVCDLLQVPAELQILVWELSIPHQTIVQVSLVDQFFAKSSATSFQDPIQNKAPRLVSFERARSLENKPSKDSPPDYPLKIQTSKFFPILRI
jgi:hypothetical protein